jgi:hypothetical protein
MFKISYRGNHVCPTAHFSVFVCLYLYCIQSIRNNPSFQTKKKKKKKKINYFVHNNVPVIGLRARVNLVLAPTSYFLTIRLKINLLLHPTWMSQLDSTLRILQPRSAHMYIRSVPPAISSSHFACYLTTLSVTTII